MGRMIRVHLDARWLAAWMLVSMVLNVMASPSAKAALVLSIAEVNPLPVAAGAAGSFEVFLTENQVGAGSSNIGAYSVDLELPTGFHPLSAVSSVANYLLPGVEGAGFNDYTFSYLITATHVINIVAYGNTQSVFGTISGSVGSNQRSLGKVFFQVDSQVPSGSFNVVFSPLTEIIAPDPINDPQPNFDLANSSGTIDVVQTPEPASWLLSFATLGIPIVRQLYNKSQANQKV